MRPTVLIVDDSSAFRASARALLEAEGFAVIGEAGDGRSAVAAAKRLQPLIVLLDIQLPDEDGFVVADRLASQPDPPIVVLVSGRPEDTYTARLAHTTARAFDGALAAILD